MVLGYNRRFVSPILSGVKIHTLRLDPTNRWRAGMLIHFAIGVRTKHYEQFEENTCSGTQVCVIDYTKAIENEAFSIPMVYVDGRALWCDEIETLAKNDGFANASEFCKWFSKDWSGKIIHWTAHRY